MSERTNEEPRAQVVKDLRQAGDVLSGAINAVWPDRLVLARRLLRLAASLDQEGPLGFDEATGRMVPLDGSLLRVKLLENALVEARRLADRNAEAYIEASNPGIDMDEVRRIRAERWAGDALSIVDPDPLPSAPPEPSNQ